MGDLLFMTHRRRVRLTTVAIVVLTSVWMAAAPIRSVQKPTPADVARLDQMLAAYSAGDDHAVEDALRTPDGLASLNALTRVFNGTPEWNRMKAAFLLEIVAASSNFLGSRQWAARYGQRLLLARRDPFGFDANDDRFEMLWHQAALGILQGLRQPEAELDYLDAIEPRLTQASRRGVTADTRFALARAIAAAGVCCPARNEPSNLTVIYRGPSRPSAPTFRVAVSLFELAAKEPALQVEALVRGGVLQFQMEHPAGALAWLDRVPADHGDVLLHYSQFLTRARALDALNRAEESAAAYRSARVDYPTAQTPAIGLAAALLRAGATKEAVSVAADARHLPDLPTDPWFEFQKADLRFVAGWLAEIRKLRK
jgi:hypothetical protein